MLCSKLELPWHEGHRLDAAIALSSSLTLLQPSIHVGNHGVRRNLRYSGITRARNKKLDYVAEVPLVGIAESHPTADHVERSTSSWDSCRKGVAAVDGQG